MSSVADSTEKEKGVYDFSKYDVEMKHANNLGITVVGVLFGNNKLYEDDKLGGIQTETGRKGFADFAAALADHYQDHNVLWEVWNEPNVKTFWRNNGKANSPEFAKEYASLVNTVAPAMLKADPKCIVLAGSVSNYWEPSYEWTESCFKNGILKSGIRGWSVHPYGVRTPEEFGVGHQRTRALLKKYGAADLPILNTERGFAVAKTAEGWSGGSEEWAREYQAWHLVRQYMIDQMYGIPLTVWYEWDGKKFGISDEGSSRPAFKACQIMFEQMTGYHFVRRIPADSDSDYVLLFQNDTGQRKLVAWTAPPPGGSPDETFNHRVSIELKTDQTIDIVNVTGTVEKRPTDFLLSLSGAPQYISIPKSMEISKCVSLADTPKTTDLDLFTANARWQFIENTGKGKFALTKDETGTPLGVLHYDFRQSKKNTRPYVLAQSPVQINAGVRELQLQARSNIKQQLTFRIVDSTGQTLQTRGKLTGSGEWETLRIPLNRRMEHWDGANDGTVHFPVKQLVLSVPLPAVGNKTGEVEYARVLAIPDLTNRAPTNVAPPKIKVTKIAGPAPEKLLEAGSWKFLENTGKGSFKLAKSEDGKAVGILHYDFRKSTSKSRPYVLTTAAVTVDKRATQLSLMARSNVAQQLTFRVVDSTDQTHQFKTFLKGTGKWEEIRIPLTRKLEHWGGAKDGKVHFPITSLVFSVPLPDENHRIGTVEYAEIKAVNGTK